MVAPLFLLLLGISSTVVTSTPLEARQAANYDEVFVLASCDNEKTGSDLKIADRIHYYVDDYNRLKGVRPTETMLMDAINFSGKRDGHIPWNAGVDENNPVSSKLKDGREVKVWGLPATDAKVDEGVAVLGSGRFSGKELQCYKGVTSKYFWKQDGFKCREAFTCTHSNRFIRRTIIDIDTNVVSVGTADCSSEKPIKNAKEAFSFLKTIRKPDATDIGDGCKLSFVTVKVPEQAPNYDDTTPEQIANIFINHVGANVEANRTRIHRRCRIPGYMGADTYRDRYQDTLTYPRYGSFRIEAGQQANPMWTEQTRVDFEVTCKCAGTDPQLMNLISGGLSAFGWVGQAFGTVAAAINIKDMEKC